MVTVVQLRGNPEWINVKDFGAKGDGVNEDTDAIRNAIEATLDATPAKPAILYFPRGTYRTKPLYMTSNCLWLGDGIDRTIIKRIADPNDTSTYDYPPVVFLSEYETVARRSFIKPRRADTDVREQNFGIKDLTIDGSGYDWGYTPRNESDPRPAYQRSNHTLLCLLMKDLYFESLKIIDSMNFTCVLRRSQNIYMSNIIIDGDSNRQAYNYNNLSDSTNWGSSQPMPDDPDAPPHAGKRRWNQDGLDIDGSSDVFCNGLKIFSQDDCIAIWVERASEMSNIHITGADLTNMGLGRNIIFHYASTPTFSTTDQTIRDVIISDVICRSAASCNILIAPMGSNDIAEPNTTKKMENIILDNIVIPRQPAPTLWQHIFLDLGRSFSNNPSANISQRIINLCIRSIHEEVSPHRRLLECTTPKREEYVLQRCVFDIRGRYIASTTSIAPIILRYAKDIVLKGVLYRDVSYGREAVTLKYIQNLDMLNFVVHTEDFTVSGGRPTIVIDTNVSNLLLPPPTQLSNTYFVGPGSGIELPSSIYISDRNRQVTPTVTEWTTSPVTIINTSKNVQHLYISRSGSATWEATTDAGNTWSSQSIALPNYLVLVPNMGVRITFNPTNTKLFTFLYPA